MLIATRLFEVTPIYEVELQARISFKPTILYKFQQLSCARFPFINGLLGCIHRVNSSAKYDTKFKINLPLKRT